MRATKMDDEKSNKKILLITYHFPPSNAVGGVRIVNFAKNLKKFSWTPYVLTISDNYIDNAEYDRLKNIRSIKIHRTILLPTLMQGYKKLKRLYCNSLSGKKNVTKVAPVKSTGTKMRGNGGYANVYDPSQTFMQKIKRIFISLFFALPDWERNWILPASYRAIWIIKQKKIDCIMTSSPPHTVQLIGFLVKLFTGVIWVADFRDPWLQWEGGKIRGIMYKSSALSLKIENWLHKKVVSKADMVVANTKTFCEELTRVYSDENREKFKYIPNGFDPDNFQKFKGVRKYDVFTLTYTGSLYVGRTPKSIFTAVQKLIKEGRLEKSQIKIKLIGQCQNADGVPTVDMARSYGLESVVEVVNELPYEKAMEIISKSHVALLIQPDYPNQIPAKVYDYMGVGARVLSVTEEGATADLVNSTKIGKSFRAIDIEGISDFIYQSVNDMSMEKYENNGLIDKYKIETITEKLVNHISNVQTRFK